MGVRGALTVIGTVIGAYFGNPQLGFAIGSFVGGLVDPEIFKAPSIGDVANQTSAEGVPCPLYAGVAGGAGNLIYKSPVDVVTVQEGGKGGEPIVESERLYCTFAIRIGASLLDGPGVRNGLTGLVKIWENEKLVYDVSPTSEILAASIAFSQQFTWYPGSETQDPDPAIEAILGEGNVPAYRGRSYIVFPRKDVTDMRGAVPQYRFEVAAQGDTEPYERVGQDVFFTANRFSLSADQMEVYETDITVPAFVKWLATNTGTVPVYVRAFAPQFSFYAQAFNAGWIGDPGDDFELSASLRDTSQIRFSHADGSIEYVTDPGFIFFFTNELLPGSQLGPRDGYMTLPPDITTIRLQVIFPAWSELTASATVELRQPDPIVVNEPYIALTNPLGVLIGEDTGAVWITDPAPDLSEVTGEGVSLESVILAASRRVKFDAWDIDLADLDVPGLVLASQGYTAQNLFNALRWVYLLDGADYDGALHLPVRGGDIIASLTDDDMLESDESELTKSLRSGDDRRAEGIRRPLKLNLMYPNRTVGYQLTKATSPNYGDRGDAVNEVTLEVPVVLEPTLAAPRLADILEKIGRADAEGEIVRLVHEGAGAKFTPGDIVNLEEPGLTRRCRIESIKDGGTRKRLLMRVDRPHAYLSQAIGQDVPAPPRPPSSLTGQTVLLVLNAPALTDAQDLLGVTVGLGAAMSGWTGATLEYSSDGGATWVLVGNFRRRAIMGTLAATLPFHTRYCLDAGNVLSVRPFLGDDELDSLTFAQMLTERNAILIGKSDGQCEVLQYQVAEDEGDGTWSLTTLVRGRLGTDPAEHADGTVWMTAESSIFVPLPAALRGRTLLFRATTFGTSPDTAMVYGLLWDPQVSQLELPPAQLAVERTGGNLVGSWDPRHRFGTELAPVASQNFTGWRVDIDGTSFDTTTAGFTVADTFGPSATVTVAALNRITDAGASAEETV